MTTSQSAQRKQTDVGEVKKRRNNRQITTVLVISAVVWLALGTWLLVTNNPPPTAIETQSTTAHGVLFFGLALTVWALSRVGSYTRSVAPLLLVVAAAPLTEFIQLSFLENRSGTFSDVVADLVGILIAVISFEVLAIVLSTIRARTIAAIGSVVALTLVALNLIWAQPAVANAWECRGQNEVSVADGVPAFQANLDTEQYEALDFRSAMCGAVANGEITVGASFSSDTNNQDGPTRIISSSEGIESTEVNFHIAQTGPHLNVRLRAGVNNGFHELVVEDVITPGVRQVVVLRASASGADVWLDGRPVGELPLPQDGIDGWKNSYPLNIGDELGGGRDFQGVVHDLTAFDYALADEEIVAISQTLDG